MSEKIGWPAGRIPKGVYFEVSSTAGWRPGWVIVVMVERRSRRGRDDQILPDKLYLHTLQRALSYARACSKNCIDIF